MRISDWSSDVCSSDLGLLDTLGDNEAVGSAAPEGYEQCSCGLPFGLGFLQCQLGFENAGIGAGLDEERILVAAHAPDRFGAHLLFEFDAILCDPDPLLGDLAVDKLGSASCRERVCQLL